MDHRPSMPTILTSDGHILSPQQVAEHLKRRFETEEFQAAAVNKTIKKVVVLYSPTAEIVRLQPDHTYEDILVHAGARGSDAAAELRVLVQCVHACMGAGRGQHGFELCMQRLLFARP